MAIAGSAAAHAVLLGSDPPHRAVLASAPHHVVLRFNEPVTPIFVRLIDAGGRERPLPGHAQVVDHNVRAHLPHGLEAGVYVLSYRVTSADGHPVGGAIFFAVGAAPNAWNTHAVAVAADGGWRAAAIVNRTVHLICLFVAAGSLLFAALVERRIGESSTPARLAAAAAAATAAIGVVLHGAALTGGADLGTAAYWRAVFGAPQTASAAATLAGIACAFVLAPRLGPAWRGLLTVAGAAFALVAAGITGHTAADTWFWWPVAALHLLVAGFWLGSLVPLLRALRSRPAPEVANLLRRFSRLAMAGVAILVAAGTVLALDRMHGVEDLLETNYGKLVLVKIAGAALLIAIAATNKLRHVPAVVRGRRGAARNLRLSIGTEFVAMVGVIGIAALLAYSDPNVAHTHHHHSSDTTPPARATLRLEAGGRIAAVELYPAKPGRNTLTVAFATREGKPLAPLEATLELAMPAAGIESFAVKLLPLGQGRFTAEIVETTLPGRWRMRIDALLSDFDKAIFRGEVEIR
jgi:copper transport protein